MYRILLAILFLFAACSTEMSEPPANGSGGTGGNIGSGGAGGSGDDGPGGGGSGHPGPEAGDWQGIQARLEWRHQGFGEVFELLVADFAGDGKQDIAVGARRPLLLKGDGSSLSWFADWEPPEQLTLGGDSVFVYGLAAIPSDRGGHDLLVTSSLGDAYLLDSATGQRIWHTDLDLRLPFSRFDTFGDPADPLFFPAYGTKAFRAKTGEAVWETEPLDEYVVWVSKARFQADQHPGLLIATEADVELGPEERLLYPPVLYAYTAEGELLYKKPFPDQGQLMRAFVADLDGEGLDSPLALFQDGTLKAFHPDGSFRWETTIHIFENAEDHMLEDVSTADIDGDGKEELLLLFTDGSEPSYSRTSGFALLGSDGELRGSHRFPLMSLKAQFAQAGEQTVILASLGNPYDRSVGQLQILDPKVITTQARILLERDTPNAILHSTILERNGDLTVVYAGIDGIMRAIDFSTGEDAWEHQWLAWVERATVLRQDDSHFVATADEYGNISLYDHRGGKLWHRTMAKGNAMEITAMTRGRFGPIHEERVVIAALTRSPEAPSVIETYSLDGQLRTSWEAQGRVHDLLVRDIDGDGEEEVLYIEGMAIGGQRCHLVILSDAGIPLEKTGLAPCFTGELRASDTDGDGTMEIAVRTDPGPLPEVAPRLLLFEHDGTLRWYVDESLELSLWLELNERGLITGGATTSESGFVALRDLGTGEKIWRSLLPHDGKELDRDASSHGIAFHADGDYIATHTSGSMIYLLDQKDGHIYWSETSNRPGAFEEDIHGGAPLAFVPSTKSTPAFLSVSQGSFSRIRSHNYLFSLNGQLKFDHLMHSPPRFVETIEMDDGRPAVAIVTSLGIYVFGLEAEGDSP